MDLGLRGKRAIVTGSTKGIGRAIVDQLAAEGCDTTKFMEQVKDLIVKTVITG